MRILTVGTLYPPHDGGGGYEILWRSAVAHLRAAGHEVRVLATDHVVAGAADTEPDVHRELRWYWAGHGFRGSLREALAIERHNRAVLRRHLRDFRPERVAWWSMGGLSLSLLEVARGAGVPAVAFVIDDWLDYGRRADAWHRRFGRVSWGDVAHYAFVSRHTRDHAWFRGIPIPESSILHSGIDPALIDPAPEREWDWSLLYVGRVDARKGIATAVAALDRLPEATLTVAGDGPDRVEHPRVRYLGRVGRDELAAVYADADAVVFPVEWREPWGLVPLEAMGRGRPVVATGRGGSGEYLRDGENALLFEAGDAAALADQVKRLESDTDLRARLREGGLATARRHTEPIANAQIEALLAAAHMRGPAPANSINEGEEIVVLGGERRAHELLHRRFPGERWAVQGRIVYPREPFARWAAGPPLRRGEIGTVHLDRRNLSVKRSLLERVGEEGLADAVRLYYEPRLQAHFGAPSPPEVRLRRMADPVLADRLANAAKAGPARGRLGRALVAYVPERVPWLGPRVWANATDYYERMLAAYAPPP